MRAAHWTSARAGKGLLAPLVPALAIVLMALIEGGSSSRAVAQSEVKMEATIFSYDGKDFVRSKTTMMTEDGKSAVNTKLEHDSPAYQALMQKHSYIPS
jgi:Cache 3/Cache 2 fusion domain